jgi:hypothetical protein
MAARDMFYAHSQLDVEARLIARRRISRHRVDEDKDLQERLSRVDHGPNVDPEAAPVLRVEAYLYQMTGYWKRVGMVFTEPRCRRASICAATAMLTQQMTGVNTIGEHP